MIIATLTTDSGEYTLTAQPLEDGVSLNVSRIDGTVIYDAIVQDLAVALKYVAEKIGKIKEYKITHFGLWENRLGHMRADLWALARFFNNELN
jgi:hypothetical protein